jgi:sec-independent protein translocase protein TatB
MFASPPIQMGSLGMADSLILMVLALVVFGPRRLPQIGRQLGKLMYEFRKASNDFKFQMEEELRLSEDAERRKKEEAERQHQATLAPPAPESTPATDPYATAATDAPYPPVPAAEPEQPAATEATGPQIAPPSTGEVVSGAPPWRKYQSMHAASSEPAAEAEAMEAAPPAEAALPASDSPEALTHNG